MAQQFATIEVQEKTRPCWVNGRRGIFHRWTDSARPAKARGEENDPDAKYYQLYSVHALVEFEDGTVARIWPADLKFADGGEFGAYNWESMEEKRDALPYVFGADTAEETQPARKACSACAHGTENLEVCAAVKYHCDECDVQECPCRTCRDFDHWTPQGGTA
jgi:hypothetical protein